MGLGLAHHSAGIFLPGIAGQASMHYLREVRGGVDVQDLITVEDPSGG